MEKKLKKKRKQGINSGAKGKVGEREASDVLKEHLGIEARRGVQYQGGTDSPDLVTSLDGVHFEVKRTEALALYPALEQSKSESGSDEVPVVLHRRNRQEWVVIVSLADLKRLAERIYLQTPE